MLVDKLIEAAQEIDRELTDLRGRTSMLEMKQSKREEAAENFKMLLLQAIEELDKLKN